MDIQPLMQFFIVYGPWIVFAALTIQCAGIPFPAASVLLSGLVYARFSQQINFLEAVLLGALAGVILGNMLGYWMGRSAAQVFVRHFGRSLRKGERTLKLFLYLLDRYGSSALVMARFFSVTRTFAGPFSGMMALSFKKFCFYSILGGCLWVFCYSLIAYYLGSELWQATGPFSTLLFLAVAILLLLLAWLLLTNLHKLREKAEKRYPASILSYLGDTSGHMPPH